MQLFSTHLVTPVYGVTCPYKERPAHRSWVHIIISIGKTINQGSQNNYALGTSGHKHERRMQKEGNDNSGDEALLWAGSESELYKTVPEAQKSEGVKNVDS